jgi:hypothetical protein
MRRWLLAFFLVAAGGAFYLGWPVFQPASSERDQQLGLTDEQRQRIEQLEAIGYLPGVEPAEEEAHGVVQHVPARTFSGPMLYASGHAPEAGLIDTDGTELHRWNFPARDAWPGYPLVHQARAQLFRRAYVYPNGDLLVIFEGIGLVRIDKNSKRVWALLNRAHHAADILADGTIFALTRRAAVVPAVDPERPVLEDFIVELGPDGSRRRQVSILRALLNSEYRPMATVADPRLPPQGMVQFENGDLHHTNSIQILLRDHPTIPKLRAGTALVSSPQLCALMVVDLEEERVVWLYKGDFVAQHDASFLGNGNVLLFDNQTRDRGSRVLEIDTTTEEVVWQYPPPGSRDGFYSDCCGTVSRLPNGNTQIVITTEGRALEVTPQHEVVWEFRNPSRVGRDGELISSLFEGMRLEAGFSLDWTSRAR